MIIVKLRGGLGNQLFQYALGRHLAVLNQTELKLDVSLLDEINDWTYRTYGLGEFNIKATLATKDEINRLRRAWRGFAKFLGGKNAILEPYFHFYSPALLLKDGVYLDGYWQSEKYFRDIVHLIREDLTPKTPLSKPCQAFKEFMTQCNSVSVHIRRGDYASTSKANRYLKPCEADYYQKAIDYLINWVSKPVFFIFSDDILWVKANFKIDFPTHYIEGNSAQEDLLLMASCQHHIIANSTFSWWGAWLNRHPDKIVTAPQKWFSTERFDTRDLLPETWIRL